MRWPTLISVGSLIRTGLMPTWSTPRSTSITTDKPDLGYWFVTDELAEAGKRS